MPPEQAAGGYHGAFTDDAPQERERPLVLIVDDDPNVRVLIDSTLSQQGFSVAEAANGEAGLGLCDELRPDLVLCDVLMPGMDGFAVCAELQRRPFGKHLPIVMLTGLEDFDSIEKAYALGATGFIVKPVKWPLLPRQLRYILRASRALERLQRSEERYALAARGANDGLWDWDLQAGSMYFSPRWKEMLGYSPEDLGEDVEEWLGRIHPEDQPQVRRALDAHIRGELPHFQCEYRIRGREGGYVWVTGRGLGVSDEQGRCTRMAGSQTDISERKRIEAQLLHDALHDPLTGLPNRELFLERLKHCINLLDRQPGNHFAVMFLDLDRFKNVNDSLGHLLGDQLLIEVSRRLQGVMRRGDTLARLGGDEFTFLLEGVHDVSSISHMAERVQATLQAPLLLGEQEIFTSGSMGIAVSSSGYCRPEDMLRDADAAMYQAKTAGRGCYKIFDDQMHAGAVHALQTEAELRSALERGEFLIHYQPIVCLDPCGISGFEALLRWQHPARGLLAPDAFMSIACETRLIVPVGRWVLREACAQLSRWRQRWTHAADWFVSVNLSSQELAQPDIVNAVREALRGADLPGQCLKLEITETSLINNDRHAMQVMRELRECEVHISIDDFGTGYSSFNYLHRFPFDVLKIDRSFVHGLSESADQREIVKAIITLAHNLHLSVVAEGNERGEDLQALQALNCEFAQGYSISRPRPSHEVAAFVEEFARKDGQAAG